MSGRVVVVLVLDVAIWALILWYLLASDSERRAASWRCTTQVCQGAALMFGQCALKAERRYWEEVRP